MAVYSVEAKWHTGERELVCVPDPEAHFPEFLPAVGQTERAILDFVYDQQAEKLQRDAMRYQQDVTDLMAVESSESLAVMMEWAAGDEAAGDLEPPIGYATGQDLPLRSREALVSPRGGNLLRLVYHEASAESVPAFSMQAQHYGPKVTWLQGANQAHHFYFSDASGAAAPRNFLSAIQVATETIAWHAWYKAAGGRIPQQRSAGLANVGRVPIAEDLGSFALRNLRRNCYNSAYGYTNGAAVKRDWARCNTFRAVR